MTYRAKKPIRQHAKEENPKNTTSSHGFFTTAARSVAVVNVSRSLFVWVYDVTSNSYIVDEVIEVDEMDEANMSAAAGK